MPRTFHTNRLNNECLSCVGTRLAQDPHTIPLKQSKMLAKGILLQYKPANLHTCHNGLDGPVRCESNQVVGLLSLAASICTLFAFKLSTAFRTIPLCCVGARIPLEEFL